MGYKVQGDRSNYKLLHYLWKNYKNKQKQNVIDLNTDDAAGTVAPTEPAHQGMVVAYHASCSLQHGQQIKTYPKDLLKAAGFTVVEPADPHLCCGSAGTYNLMQPEISGQLKERKVRTLEAKNPDVIAAGNIGCMMQIGSAASMPIVHTVELLDWASGGPKPPAMNGEKRQKSDVPRLR